VCVSKGAPSYRLPKKLLREKERNANFETVLPCSQTGQKTWELWIFGRSGGRGAWRHRSCSSCALLWHKQVSVLLSGMFMGFDMIYEQVIIPQ